MVTYYTSKLGDRRVDAQDLVDDSVEIGKTVCELIVRRVCTMFEDLVSQLRLHAWVTRELEQSPLGK